MPPTEVARETRSATSLRVFTGALALQDLVLFLYLLALAALVARAAPGAVQLRCLRGIGVCLGLLLAGIAVARVVPRLPDTLRGVGYRAGLLGALVTSYTLLREIVPLVRPDAVDATLDAIDVRVLGFEPSLVLERFNRPAIVEWFAFFYFAYYFVIIGYVVGVTFAGRPGRHMTEFALGTFLVYCVGHLGYMAVPGEGPHALLRSEYAGPVAGGFFWNVVWNAYATSSAAKDVFPSLHVGAPTWFTLYALGRARRDVRWRWIAATTAFVTVNIAVATLLLRWHYAVDLCAGVGLAAAAAALAPRLARWEENRRASLGLGAVWPPPAPDATESAAILAEPRE